jgi:hypothetical protein
VGEPEGKRPLRRPRRRWANNIEMDLREIRWRGMDWLRMRTSECDYEPSGFMKFWEVRFSNSAHANVLSGRSSPHGAGIDEKQDVCTRQRSNVSYDVTRCRALWIDIAVTRVETKSCYSYIIASSLPIWLFVYFKL